MRSFGIFLTSLFVFAAAGMPHIGFIMPSGARQGSQVELIIGGQKFFNADEIFISGDGVTVVGVDAVRKPPHPENSQRRYINKWLNNIHSGNPVKPPLPESTEGWRHHPWYDRLNELSDGERDILYRFLFVRSNALQASPAISQRLLVRLYIAPDATPGERELRVVCRKQLSNPLKFFISKVPEYREPYFPMPPRKSPVVHCNFPAVLNGQIMPGERDNFTFTARKGEKLTFSAKARYLMPFIGDGVPGHFQMVMEIFDASGKSVAYADDREFDPDPELFFTAPADGKYTLQIRDALFRGRDDFVYRVEVFKGMPRTRKIAVPKIPGVKHCKGTDFAGGKVITPGVLIADTLRTPEGGRYRFRAKKGVPLMLEVYGRRQGSPIDPLLKIFDSRGKMVAACDDVPRLKAGTILHPAADPVLRFVPENDGEYIAVVSDVAGKCGRNYGYFLRIAKPQPHFKVYATPSVINVNRNGWGKVELAVERFDGFDGEIKLRWRKGGCSIDGIDSIPAKSSRSVITLQGAGRHDFFHAADLEAYTDGFAVRVIPGDEMMQAFAYTHIAPATYMVINQIRNSSGKESFRWAEPVRRVTLKKDYCLKVDINTRYLQHDADAELVMVDPPSWLKVRQGSGHISPAGSRKHGKNKNKSWNHQLKLTIYAEKEGAGKEVNQLFKVVYTTKRKNAKGQIRRMERETLLPVIRISGGSGR